MFLFIIVFLTFTVHTDTTQLSTPFRLLNVKYTALDDLAKFNDFVNFQESISKHAETMPHTLYKSHHLPDTCGFWFEVLASSFITWEIDCVFSESQQTYITCASGCISLEDAGAVCVKVGHLYDITLTKYLKLNYTTLGLAKAVQSTVLQGRIIWPQSMNLLDCYHREREK